MAYKRPCLAETGCFLFAENDGMPAIEHAVGWACLADLALRLAAQDNGVGMPYKDIPDLLGRVLSGTKYGVCQTRGKFGLGAKMALIWSKMSTGLPIEIWSRAAPGRPSSHTTSWTWTSTSKGSVGVGPMHARSMQSMCVTFYSEASISLLLCLQHATLVRE